MKMKTRKTTRRTSFFLAVVAMILFSACPNSLLEKLESRSSSHALSGSTGTLIISVSGLPDGSRSILPQTVNPADIASYDVTLIKSGSPDVVLTDLAILSAPITGLAPGEWALTVSGFDIAGKKTTEGSALVAISSGPNSASINLLPVRSAGGTGTLSVDFSYSGLAGDISASSVALVTYPARVAVNISGGVTSANPESIIINTPLPSGTYLLTFSLSRNVNAVQVSYPPVSRIVQIFDGCVSSASVALTAADITHPPAAPTNLRVTGFDGMRLTLEWDDNSDVEESFEVNIPGTSITIPAGTLLAADYPPSGDRAITVVARNRYGNSPVATFNYIAPVSITLDKQTIVLGELKTTQITATVNPSNTTLASSLSWSSVNSSIASVDGTGWVTGEMPDPISVLISASFPSSISSASASADVAVDSVGFAMGDGTPANPYRVGSIDELSLVRRAVKSHFSQTSPGFALDGDWIPIGTAANPFTGTYQGNGNAISYMNIFSTFDEPAGMFGSTAGATLSGISLLDVTASSAVPSTLGALVGSATDTTIFRCSSTGELYNVSGNSIGGLVGSSSGGSIAESRSSVNVTGVTALGGLVGYCSSTNIDNCYAIGSVTGSNTLEQIAGLAGKAEGGNITNSYATGIAKLDTGDPAQGLVGGNNTIACTYSYWDMTTSGTSVSYGGTGKTYADMIIQSTFAGWDFANIWAIDASYPYLQWEGAISIPGLSPVTLGSAGNFVILAKTAVSTVSTSAITGDIGLSPAAESFITGFSLTQFTGYSTSPQVVGLIYAADMAAPTPANMTTAISDMEIAYMDAAGRAGPDFLDVSAGEIGGQTLLPGLYKWTTSVTTSNNVTISGGANDVWIFQISGDLSVGNTFSVFLANGAQAKNIFWQVAGTVTIGTASHFEGIILCQSAITLNNGATMNGRALAQTQVALEISTVTQPIQ